MNAPDENPGLQFNFRVALAICLLAALTAFGIYSFEWFHYAQNSTESITEDAEQGRELASQRKSRGRRPNPKPPVDPIAQVVPPEIDYTPWYQRRGLGENGKFLATTPISQLLSPMPYEFAPKDSWCQCRARGVTQPHSGEDFNWSDHSKGPEMSIAPSNGVIVRITVDRSCGFGVFFYDSYGALWKFFHLNRPGYYEGNQFIAWKEGDPVFRGEMIGIHRDFPKQSPKTCGWGAHLHLERQTPFQRIKGLAKEREGKLTGGSCSTGRSRCYYDPRSVYKDGIFFKVDSKTRRNYDTNTKRATLGPGLVVSSQTELQKIIQTAKNGEGLQNPFPYRLPTEFSSFDFAGYDQPGCDLYQITEAVKDASALDEALDKKVSIMQAQPFLIGRRKGSLNNGLGPQKIDLNVYLRGKKLTSSCQIGQPCPVLIKIFAKRKSGTWDRVYENNNIRGFFQTISGESVTSFSSDQASTILISEASRVCLPSETENVVAQLTLSNGTVVYGKVDQAVRAPAKKEN